jgi:hypothetical protein
MRKASTPRGLEVPWQMHMVAMYITSVLILIRSIFRVIEFLQGNAGYLMRSEVFIYVFDAVLMLFVLLTMNWIHPSQIRSLLKGGKWAKGYRMMPEQRSTELSTLDGDGENGHIRNHDQQTKETLGYQQNGSST